MYLYNRTVVSVPSGQNIPLSYVSKHSVFFSRRCKRQLSFTTYRTFNTNLTKMRQRHYGRMETTVILLKKSAKLGFTSTDMSYLKVTILLMGEDLISSVCTEHRMQTCRWFGVLFKFLNLKVN